MAAKEITFSQVAREQILRGVQILSDAVAVTASDRWLPARGRSVPDRVACRGSRSGLRPVQPIAEVCPPWL